MIWHGVVGCVSRNVLARGEDLVPGALLLAEIDPTFDPTARGHPAYTVQNVAQVLDGVRPSSARVEPSLPAGTSAMDVMAGYLLFDALVLNRDRHAANWALARRRDGSGHAVLCPMYDNASSLALSLSDDSMRKRCESQGIASYAEREGWARPFASTDRGTARLPDVARDALGLCTTVAQAHWLAQVDRLSSSAVTSVVDAVPEMSQVVRTFVVALLMSTRKALIDGIEIG